MTAWTKFVTKFYNEKKKHDKSYMFKDALIGAAKVYKKGGSNKGEGEHDEHDEHDKREGGNGEELEGEHDKREGGNEGEPAENQELELKPELMEQEGGKKKARKAKKSAKKSRKSSKKSRKSSRKARK